MGISKNFQQVKMMAIKMLIIIILFLFTQTLSDGIIRRQHIHSDAKKSHPKKKHVSYLLAKMMEGDVGGTKKMLYNNTDTNSNTTHSDKYQSTAFFFSLFLGTIGLDRYYIGDDVIGSVKLALFILVICSPCFLVLCYGTVWPESRDDGDEDISESACRISVIAFVLWILSALGLLTWIICDIVRFSLNEVPDSNGLKLIPFEFG